MSEEVMTTGEQLIKELDDLRRHLLTLSDRLNNSGIERTQGLKDNMGLDCPYFKRSLNIFMKKDYEELRDMVQSINNLFNLIEGKSNG